MHVIERDTVVGLSTCMSDHTKSSSTWIKRIQVIWLMFGSNRVSGVEWNGHAYRMGVIACFKRSTKHDDITIGLGNSNSCSDEPAIMNCLVLRKVLMFKSLSSVSWLLLLLAIILCGQSYLKGLAMSN